jgi:glucan biosynthesis protein C
VEYVDSDSAYWTRGFWAFVPHVWTMRPPPPGPTWFLGVLLVFSLVYAALRTMWPRRRTGAVPLRAWHLVLAVAAVALASFLLRMAVPLGEERWHVSIAQAPAWVAGFTLGVLGGEMGWFDPMTPRLARVVRRVAWAAVTLCVGFVVLVAGSPAGMDLLSGGGTWQSLALAALEALVMVTTSLWLVDLFQRRFDHQGALARRMSRAAYGAFLLHQVVLVALVVAARAVPWPPELRYVSVAALGIGLSFGLAALLLRLPGVSRLL